MAFMSYLCVQYQYGNRRSGNVLYFAEENARCEKILFETTLDVCVFVFV